MLSVLHHKSKYIQNQWMISLQCWHIMMGIACLLRATSCPVSSLPLPEHWLTSRADSTQYSAKQMRVKKRNPISIDLFPCTTCVCVTVQHAVKVKLHTAGEREALIRQSEDTLDPGHTSRVGAGTGGNHYMQEDLAHQGRQTGRQTEIEEHVQGQLDGHLLVHPGGHLSTHLDHWLPYRTEEEVMFLSHFWKRAEEIKTGINKACMTVLLVLPCMSLYVIYYSAQTRGDVFFA